MVAFCATRRQRERHCMNTIELSKKIVAQSGTEDIDIPMLATIQWFAGPWDATAPMTVIRHNETFPLNPAMLIFAMFQDDDEFRVYALPIKASTPPMPPTRYRLSKTNRVFSAESMSLGVFEEEMVDELQVLAGISEDPVPDTLDPDDLTECPACGVEVPALVHCGACGAKLPEEIVEAPPAANVATAPATALAADTPPTSPV
jgi:hypothetical protein